MPIRLHWEPPTGVPVEQIFGYNLYKRVGPGALDETMLYQTLGLLTDYDDYEYAWNILQGVGYGYAVKARLQGGTSAFSNEVLITATNALPGYEEEWPLRRPTVIVNPGYEEEWDYTLPSTETLQYLEEWDS
jgi:hypothetical protein